MKQNQSTFEFKNLVLNQIGFKIQEPVKQKTDKTNYRIFISKLWI